MTNVFEFCIIIDELLNQCQQIQIDTSLFLFLVISKLSGDAKSLTILENTNTWEDLRYLLIEIFNDGKSDSIRQNEFFKCCQNPNESVQSYSLRLRKCIANIVIRLSVNEREPCKMLLNNQAKIINGLNSQIKDSRNFNKAVIIAKQEEQFLKDRNDFSSKNICLYCNQSDHLSNNCEELLHLIMLKNKKYNNNNYGIPKNNRVHNCGDSLINYNYRSSTNDYANFLMLNSEPVNQNNFVTQEQFQILKKEINTLKINSQSLPNSNSE